MTFILSQLVTVVKLAHFLKQYLGIIVIFEGRLIFTKVVYPSNADASNPSVITREKSNSFTFVTTPFSPRTSFALILVSVLLITVTLVIASTDCPFNAAIVSASSCPNFLWSIIKSCAIITLVLIASTSVRKYLNILLLLIVLNQLNLEKYLFCFYICSVRKNEYVDTFV